ncbi:MAG TPA: hypothetical protein VMC81_02190 [Rhodocyclaceae bacterium]|nr:hypothetical protein [Rhodocyclaceae bacterium]
MNRNILPWLLLPFVQACMVLPRTFEVYDPDCHVVARHMDLETVQVASISHCSNDGCAALVVAAAATVAASAIVSGSIVVVGNVVYWFEKQGRCRREPVSASCAGAGCVPPPTSPAAASAP